MGGDLGWAGRCILFFIFLLVSHLRLDQWMDDQVVRWLSHFIVTLGSFSPTLIRRARGLSDPNRYIYTSTLCIRMGPFLVSIQIMIFKEKSFLLRGLEPMTSVVTSRCATNWAIQAWIAKWQNCASRGWWTSTKLDKNTPTLKKLA